MSASDSDIERTVDAALRAALPEVDLREVVVSGGRDPMLRVVVDREGGVDHELCVEVTAVLELAGLRDSHGIEVSSPGPEPPLRTLDHYRSAVGRRIRLRIDRPGGRARERTGTLESVAEEALTVRFAPEGEPVEIPIRSVRRARCLSDDDAPLAGARGGAAA